MIPKIIHFVWIGPPMPDWASRNVEGFRELNPGFEVQVHGEEVLQSRFEKAYRRIESEWGFGEEEPHILSRKSDILRVCALGQKGGWYFDCDCLPLRPLEELYARAALDRDTFLVPCTSEGLLANGVIGTVAKSEFLRKVADAIFVRGYERDVLHWGAFGPALYTSIANVFPHLVTLGEYSEWFPLEGIRECQEAYLSIVRNECSRESIATVFGEGVPYILHMQMQDELEIAERA